MSHFSQPTAQNWEIDAGLATGDLTTYDRDSGTPADTLSFTNPIGTGNSSIQLYGVNLGQVTVAGGSSIEVFINNSGSGFGQRTWYDGVGYEVIPEPSTALLGVPGLLALLRRRR